MDSTARWVIVVWTAELLLHHRSRFAGHNRICDAVPTAADIELGAVMTEEPSGLLIVSLPGLLRLCKGRLRDLVISVTE